MIHKKGHYLQRLLTPLGREFSKSFTVSNRLNQTQFETTGIHAELSVEYYYYYSFDEMMMMRICIPEVKYSLVK